MALSAIEAELVESLRNSTDEMVDLLRELVDQNSFTQNHEGVNEVGRMVERHLQTSGLRVGAFVTGRSGQHLIARSPETEGNRLMLLGHLDTVFPPSPDAPAEDQRFRRDGETIYGPGVTDMKGGLVVMMTAVRKLAERGLLEGRSLSVVLTADEEEGSPTGHDLVHQEAADHHLCLVFETGSEKDGGTTFVTERKGCGRVAIETTGVESHAGARKEKGLSAAEEMAKKILALEALNDFERGMTVNVGVARAGTVANTVPGFARLEIDYRFREAADGEELDDQINEIATRSETHNIEFGLRCNSKLIPGPRLDPMDRTDAVERMAQRIKDYGADLGLELEEEFRGGASDGNIASAAGCPTVDGLGTVGGKIHSGDEWARVSSLGDRAALCALTMLRFWQL